MIRLLLATTPVESYRWKLPWFLPHPPSERNERFERKYRYIGRTSRNTHPTPVSCCYPNPVNDLNEMNENIDIGGNNKISPIKRQSPAPTIRANRGRSACLARPHPRGGQGRSAKYQHWQTVLSAGSIRPPLKLSGGRNIQITIPTGADQAAIYD